MKILKNKVIFFLIIVFFVVLSSLILTPQALLSQNQFPKPVGHVNDFANVIPAATERKIAAICLEVKQKTGAEIAILTVETIGDQQYTDYTIRLMEDENWQLGEQGKDNGVLIFQTVQERKFRIEVGYGLEGIIPDGLAGEIRDRYVFPFFRKGDYGNGLLAGTQAIAGIIARDAGVEITGAVRINQDRRAVRKKSPVASLFKFFFNRSYFLIFPWWRTRKKKRKWSFTLASFGRPHERRTRVWGIQRRGQLWRWIRRLWRRRLRRGRSRRKLLEVLIFLNNLEHVNG